ncbi:hypothetical protein QBC45DRAFT_458226 [Copromyces sp. CBS 386.78]|nr:hypothetical protein QBC45DRAFT_458226 [Copromyces sp. CBS 386.78]
MATPRGPPLGERPSRKVVRFLQGSPHPALAERPATSAPSGPSSLGTKTARQSAVDRTREEKANKASESDTRLPHPRPASDNRHNRPPPPSRSNADRASLRERSVSVSYAPATRDRSPPPAWRTKADGDGALRKRPASAPHAHMDRALPARASDTRDNRPPPSSWRTKPNRAWWRDPGYGTVGWYLDAHLHHPHQEDGGGDGGDDGNGGNSHPDGDNDKS